MLNNKYRDKVMPQNLPNKLRMIASKIAIIKQCPKKDQDDRPLSEQKWCLYDSKGEDLLGRHPSKEKAIKQEQAIEINKHK
jgi:hypothetical protein